MPTRSVTKRVPMQNSRKTAMEADFIPLEGFLIHRWRKNNRIGDMKINIYILHKRG